MAVRVHVLRTCDRCGRPIDIEGAVPVQQLKEGDVIPMFHRAVLRVIREEPAMDGGAPSVKTLGTFTDLCETCENVIERALDTLLRRASEPEETGVGATGAGESAEPKRRAGRKPRTVNPEMPGPHGVTPGTGAEPEVTTSPAGTETSKATETSSAFEPETVAEESRVTNGTESEPEGDHPF